MTRLYIGCTFKLKMGIITKSQLDAVWNDQGLKYRIGRFRGWLVERGMNTYISAEKLQSHFYDVMEAFFVLGVEETLDGKQSKPADVTNSSEPVSDTESEGG